MSGITIIDLWPIVAECAVCGADSHRSGIPMYEDLVLPNDWSGEWGGRPACERCRIAQEEITEPVTLAEFRAIAATVNQTCQ